METIVAQDVSIDYIVEGEGFPLVLMPEPRGTLGLWAPYIPLLGEMCRMHSGVCSYWVFPVCPRDSGHWPVTRPVVA
jgi:hypothetical protein